MEEFKQREAVCKVEQGRECLGEDVRQTYRQQGMLHFPSLLLSHQPPLRPPLINVLPKGLRIPMDGPSANPHHRSATQSLTTNNGALRGHNAFEGKTKGRMDAACFLDAGIKIGKLTRLLESHKRGKSCGLEFQEKTRVGYGVGQEVVDQSAEKNGCGIASGGDVGNGPGGECPALGENWNKIPTNTRFFEGRSELTIVESSDLCLRLPGTEKENPCCSASPPSPPRACDSGFSARYSAHSRN